MRIKAENSNDLNSDIHKYLFLSFVLPFYGICYRFLSRYNNNLLNSILYNNNEKKNDSIAMREMKEMN